MMPWVLRMLVYIRHPRHRTPRIYPRHLHAFLLPAPNCAQRENWKAWHGAKGRATQALSISRDVAGKRPFSLSLNPSRSTARKSPQKPRCALGQPVPDVDFSLYSKPPWIGLPERSRTMKLSFASGTSGACAPTLLLVSVRDEAAYKTLKFQRLPRSFRLRYRRISLVAHPQFAR